MRIILDTNKGRIILPKSFFTELDKMNKILADGGSDKKWTAETYVKDQFEKAMKETMLRAEDKVIKKWQQKERGSRRRKRKRCGSFSKTGTALSRLERRCDEILIPFPAM